jgi:plastocyanin
MEVSMLTRNGILLGAAVFLMVGCAGVPMTSRTGAIHEVKFEEHMMPSDLRVQPGDEIRWVNHRTMPVRIDFLDGALSEVTCERGFSNFIGRRQEAIVIESNQTASLCFSKAGVITYNVRMDAAVPGGQIIEPGTIRVGPPLARQ